MSRIEIDKRIRLIFSILKDSDVRGRRVLDAGAGVGYFSAALTDLGADLVAIDMGQRLLARIREKCAVPSAVSSVLNLPFPDRYFDLVLCTEVIEHTTDPQKAVVELCRVTAEGGVLLVTTPNRLWHPAIALATALHLRPYHGHENWVRYPELRHWITSAGLQIEQQLGFNLLPHTFFCHQRFEFLDRISVLHPLMINMLVRARRPRQNDR